MHCGMSTLKRQQFNNNWGWDCTIYSLDLHGNEIWNYEQKGYVRSVRPLNYGGVLAGSHDNKIYI